MKKRGDSTGTKKIDKKKGGEKEKIQWTAGFTQTKRKVKEGLLRYQARNRVQGKTAGSIKKPPPQTD